jgi:hypothetical protein
MIAGTRARVCRLPDGFGTVAREPSGYQAGELLSTPPECA